MISTLSLLLAGPRSDPFWQALEVDRHGLNGRARPGDQLGRRISVFIKPRKRAASGQFVANANLIRVAVSLIRTATLSNRSRSVENSLLASECGRGIDRA